MRYLFFLVLFCSIFFCISCKQNQKTALEKNAANQPAKQDYTKNQLTNTPLPEDSTALLSPESKVSKSATLNFKNTFDHFLQTIQQQDSLGFNQYIHPTWGLYIIEQPGAVPKFTKVNRIQNFMRAYQNQNFFSINKELTRCDLQAEPLPTFNCDGQGDNPAGFTKEGCFVADANSFQKNEAHKYAGLSAAEISQIEKLKPLLNKTVLHTASAFRFHFGQLQGKWYVFFIELIVPCSA